VEETGKPFVSAANKFAYLSAHDGGAPPFKRAEPHGPKLSALRAGQPYG